MASWTPVKLPKPHRRADTTADLGGWQPVSSPPRPVSPPRELNWQRIQLPNEQLSRRNVLNVTYSLSTNISQIASPTTTENLEERRIKSSVMSPQTLLKQRVTDLVDDRESFGGVAREEQAKTREADHSSFRRNTDTGERSWVSETLRIIDKVADLRERNRNLQTTRAPELLTLNSTHIPLYDPSVSLWQRAPISSEVLSMLGRSPNQISAHQPKVLMRDRTEEKVTVPVERAVPSAKYDIAPWPFSVMTEEKFTAARSIAHDTYSSPLARVSTPPLAAVPLPTIVSAPSLISTSLTAVLPPVVASAPTIFSTPTPTHPPSMISTPSPSVERSPILTRPSEPVIVTASSHTAEGVMSLKDLWQHMTTHGSPPSTGPELAADNTTAQSSPVHIERAPEDQDPTDPVVTYLPARSDLPGDVPLEVAAPPAVTASSEKSTRIEGEMTAISQRLEKTRLALMELQHRHPESIILSQSIATAAHA